MEEFTPRSYQEQLMKICIKKNTIIYLPTGSGKTFIAVLVLKQLSECLSRPYSGGGKISFILVNSVPLVDQHAKYVRDHTFFKVGTYTGDLNLDGWRKNEWVGEFNKYQVLIMTSQILDNLINNNFIDLERINLLIFDECHRGVDDQPMRQIMKKISSSDDMPRIIGLTATLLNGNCKLGRVMDEVKALETTYHSQVATVDGLEAIVGYSTNPRELFKNCNEHYPSTVDQLVIDRFLRVIDIIKVIKIESANKAGPPADNLKILEPVDVLKQLRNLISDLIIHIKMMGTFGGYKACIAHMIQVERVKKHSQMHSIFVILNYVVTMMGWAKSCMFKSMESCAPDKKISNFSSDKVLKLLEILKEYEARSEEPLCCIIFVKRRFTAKIIHHILQSLKQYDPKFYHIKSNFMVGNKNNPYADTRENLFIAKKNREVLDSFVNKEINVLVSSNVLEEGVDIPKCTLVIKFDKAEEYRSYIQSKGRARHKSSLYYTIVENNERDKFSEKYGDFQEIEKKLNDFLIGKNSERKSPSKDEIDSMCKDDIIEPYFVDGPGSAQVNMISAISLLCRYCSSLSSDQYTTYAPDWYMEQAPLDPKKCRVVIFLPTICPIIDPIVGQYMRNKKDAKRAAALDACIKLHKCGELDDNLLPIKKVFRDEDVSYLFENWPESKQQDAGSKKTKRLHDKKICESVSGSIKPGDVLYLHVIDFTPIFHGGDDYNIAVIWNLYKADLRFGLLTPKPLPDLCRFPLYDSNGTIEIELKVNTRQVALSHEELMLARGFHHLIFHDLLEILKPFLVFDNSGVNSEMLLLVPVKNSNVDFATLLEHREIKDKQLEPTATARLNLKVTEDDYLHKIVSPWYRSHPTMYLVTMVCMEKNACSDFPNQEYPNFVKYYKEKHAVNILNTSLPLLLVKGLTKRLNTIKPRGLERKRKKDKRYEEMEEFLVPELVVKQDFPACLWLQARFLPSILSRVTFLLKIHRLQMQIARDICGHDKYLHNCPPLELDLHLLKYTPADCNVSTAAETCNSVVNGNQLQLEAPTTLLTKQYNKDFAMKLLEAEYSWANMDEPKDIEREIDVSVMDVEHYETFISEKVTKENRLIKNIATNKNELLAITYDMHFQEKFLRILEIEFDHQSPNLCEIYQAMTTAEANDIVNLERLETLGDSFLKLIGSLYIFFKFPKYNEGKASTLKGKLVSNKNLFYLATKKNFGGILKHAEMSAKDEWVPPCFCVPELLRQKINNKETSIVTLFHCNVPTEEQISGELSTNTIETITFVEVAPDEENSYSSMSNFLNKQFVNDKTIADSVEALMGAYFRSGGITGGIKFVEWIGIIPESENLEGLIQTTVIDPILDKNATQQNINFHMSQADDFEARLGYQFRNRAYLLQALTHASYSPNRITQSYERLEFLGDAILDFLITCFIYEHCGYLNPGEVTDLRSSLVNNNTFASLVVRYGFHKYLLMINSKLQGHIDKFAEYLARKDYVIDDEVLILLEEEDVNIAEYVDVPKVLGDIFEALAGAIYLDSDKDLKTVWRVVHKLMWKEMELFSQNVPKNVIRKLFECHTAYPSFSKAFELDNQKTMVHLEFMCDGRKKLVHGFGTNKAMAKRAAAKIALRSLGI